MAPIGNQMEVLSRIYGLARGETTVPVTIGAIHATFSNMDVRDLVRHIQGLLNQGLITNAGHPRENIGNTYYLTPEGIACHNEDHG